ncbi:MAG: iron-sulfur cluster assembly accessory protein [Rhodospirillales bacterium]|nr:iron-sulfur cluster assembly accessory protein [Rhodospirillales bacterium]
MVALTETATAVIRRLLAGNSNGATGLRIMVEQGGCAGLQYKLGLDKTAHADDHVYDFDGVRIFVDPYTRPIIDEMTVDFVDDVEQSGFVFDNPRAGATCSCGKSFAS